MSSLFAARPKVSRFAEAAIQRARLTVVPQAALGRTEAPRTPFVVLVLGTLIAGVVGLLMFNTHLQQASFTVTKLESHLGDLTAQKQSLNAQLDALRDPQRLAAAAKKQGMVAPTQPAFIRLSDGRVLGTPAPATTTDGSVRINPFPRAKPRSINPAPLIVHVRGQQPTGNTTGNTTGNAAGDTTGGTIGDSPSNSTGTSSQSSGAASTGTSTGGGRKKAPTQADSGATR